MAILDVGSFRKYLSLAILIRYKQLKTVIGIWNLAAFAKSVNPVGSFSGGREKNVIERGKIVQENKLILAFLRQRPARFGDYPIAHVKDYGFNNVLVCDLWLATTLRNFHQHTELKRLDIR